MGKARAPLIAKIRVVLDNESLAAAKRQIEGALGQAQSKGTSSSAAKEDARREQAARRLQELDARRDENQRRSESRRDAALEREVAQGERLARQADQIREREAKALERREQAEAVAAQKAEQRRIRELEQIDKIAQAELEAALKVDAAREKANAPMSVRDFAQRGRSAISSALDRPVIPQQFAALAGPLAAGAAVATAVTREYIRAYQEGSEFVRQVALTQREIGLSARQSSISRSFSAFTQDPDSPFANITVAQVQSNLQLLTDVQRGYAEATPQVESFRDALSKLGISAQNSNGSVKEVTQFTIELAKALEGLTSGEYARISTQIGGLFGKDFAAIAGAGAQNLERLAAFSVDVSQTQIDLLNERTVAIQIATNAERQFQLALTQSLTPLDTQVQNLLAAARLGGASLLQGGANTFEGARALNLAQVAGGTRELGTGLAVNFKSPQEEQIARIRFAQERFTQLQALARSQGGFVTPEMQQLMEKYSKDIDDAAKNLRKIEDAAADAAEQQAELKTRVREYKDALKELDATAKTGQAAEKERITLNKDIAASFTDVFDSIRNNAQVYDDFYSGLKDVRDEIKKLDDLAGKQVAVNVVTGGGALKGDLDDIGNLLDDVATYRATEVDETAKLVDLQENLNDKQRTEAQQAQSRAEAEARYQQRLSEYQAKYAQRVAEAQAKGKAGPVYNPPDRPLSFNTSTVSATDERSIERLNERIAMLQGGGTSAADIARDQARRNDLERRARDLGFSDLSQVNVGNVSQVFQARGLTQEEAEKRASLVEKERQLQLEDRRRQFETIQTAIGGYISALGQVEAEGAGAVDTQKTFNDAINEGVTQLDEFARSAGLFETAGFSRAVLESALNAELIAGGFGRGAEAIDQFTAKSTEAFSTFNDPRVQDALSGRKALTGADVQELGLFRGIQDERGQRELVKLAQDGELIGARVAELIATGAGVSIESGVRGALESTTQQAQNQAQNAAVAYDEAFKKVFENPYVLKFELEEQSLEAARQAIKSAIGATQAPNFEPPDVRRPSVVIPTNPYTGYGGGRATGGPVSPGALYQVGERGPELFAPYMPGAILNATTSNMLLSAAARIMGSPNVQNNSNVYNQPVTLNVAGPTQASVSPIGPAMERLFITDDMAIRLNVEQRRRYQ